MRIHLSKVALIVLLTTSGGLYAYWLLWTSGAPSIMFFPVMLLIPGHPIASVIAADADSPVVFWALLLFAQSVYGFLIALAVEGVGYWRRLR